MKHIQSGEVRAMYDSGQFSMQEAKYTLKKEYANDALFDAINKWNGGLPQEAFMELIEVVSYLVNKE
jgi:hypothetical protein